MVNLVLSLPDELIQRLDDIVPPSKGRPTSQLEVPREYTYSYHETQLRDMLNALVSATAAAQYMFDVKMQAAWTPQRSAPSSRTALIAFLLEAALEARTSGKFPKEPTTNPFPATTDPKELLRRYAYLNDVQRSSSSLWKGGVPPYSLPANSAKADQAPPIPPHYTRILAKLVK